MLALVHAAAILMFPAGAVWAWRRGGGRWLWLLTASVIGAVTIVALVAASERGGNRIVATSGYLSTASRVLYVAMTMSALPLLASAVVVRAAAPRTSLGLAYLLAVVTAFVATLAGTVVAVYAPWRG